MKLISPTQIRLYRDECNRKWAFKYIQGHYEESGPAAQLGTEVDDEQLQPYLRDGRPLDYTRASGYIAQPALEYIPRGPGRSVQHHAAFPSTNPEFGYQGFIDLWLHEGLPWLPPGDDRGWPIPCVLDFKTISNWTYAKTADDLRTDVQALTYATWVMWNYGFRVVDLVWLYLSTRKPYRAKPVHLRITADEVAAGFREINGIAEEMYAVRRANPDPLLLPPTYSSCAKYQRRDGTGGCPHVAKCNLSPDQQVESQLTALRARSLPIMSNAAAPTMTLAERMRAKQAAAGGAPAAAMAPTPPGPVVPYYAKATDADKAAASARTAALVASTDAVLGINPPESKLPPAVETPPPAAAAPAAPKRGPGRPPKTAKDAIPGDPEKAGQIAADRGVAACSAELVCLDSVTVTWAQETICAVAYNPFVVGPFSSTGSLQPGETLADAQARLYVPLAAFAEETRAAKAISFKRFLEQIGGGK